MEVFGTPEVRPSGGLRLLVLAQARMMTFTLPPNGEVRIGSADDCHIRVEEPGITALHALLQMGPTITVTDAGYGGSTIVGGQKLVAGESVVLAPGVVALLGDVATVIQTSSTTTRLRHVRSHDYFEGRLEDECIRAETCGAGFGVVRVRFASNQAQALEVSFTRHLRSLDLVAMYSADEYELLLADTPPAKAETICLRLQEHVAKSGVGNVHLGLACWPRNGRSPEALLAAAGVSQSENRAELQSAVPPTGAIEALRPLLERIAPSSINVLILGETGVGKEVLARRIHEMSSRSKLPLLCINCAALPESLLESELFGHERGAFTGAFETKPGLLEVAQGGTVLLDEVAEIPMALQAKLLRVVELRQVTRLGGRKPHDINVRFIAATNRDIELEIERGAFREDLFYRLNGVSLVVPPLRERMGEIEPLCKLFIAEFANQTGRAGPPILSRAALHLLQRYAWPGNVRELRNVIERAVTLCQGSVIDLGDLPLERLGRTLALTHVSEPPSAVPYPSNSKSPMLSSTYSYGPRNEGWQPAHDVVTTLDESVASVERDLIKHALEQCCGNQTHAARLLGLSRRALITRMERYSLPRPRKR